MQDVFKKIVNLGEWSINTMLCYQKGYSKQKKKNPVST